MTRGGKEGLLRAIALAMTRGGRGDCFVVKNAPRNDTWVRGDCFVVKNAPRNDTWVRGDCFVVKNAPRNDIIKVITIPHTNLSTQG
jgi:hypothetical protein